MAGSRLFAALSAASVLTLRWGLCFLPYQSVDSFGCALVNQRGFNSKKLGFNPSTAQVCTISSPGPQRGQVKCRQSTVGQSSQIRIEQVYCKYGQKRKHEVHIIRYLAAILRLTMGLGSGYALFGTCALRVLTEAVAPYPWLEIALFSSLSLVPYLAAKFEFLSKGIAGVLEQSAALCKRFRGNFSSVAHCMLSAIQPISGITQSVLYFFALNLLVNAVPDNFAMAVPKMLRFLDADGDGTLDAAEIEGWVYQSSAKVLMAICNAHLVRFILQIKKPPTGWKKEDASKGLAEYPSDSLLSGYWSITSTQAGWWTLVDRIITGILMGFVAYIFIIAAGCDPMTLAGIGGTGSLAIALAAQAIMGNGVSAQILLATSPCTVGDTVETGEPELRFKGVIKEIGWNATVLHDDSGDGPRKIFMPNGIMLQCPLVVFHKSEAKKPARKENVGQRTPTLEPEPSMSAAQAPPMEIPARKSCSVKKITY